MTYTKKILLLGGTGPIGNQLVRILRKTNSEVVVTSRTKSNIDGNVMFAKGNALETEFLSSLLTLHNWDVIVDFMNYTTLVFQKRYKNLLRNAYQYIFISSARVYANIGLDQLTEESPRLLDNVSDALYRQSDEYALAKAKQENLLFESPFDNWTVIRPYITFDSHRLQLAIFEKEQWLYRVLNNKTLIFPDSIMQQRTTFTYSLDVAVAISILIKLSTGLKEVFNVCSSQDFSWMEIYNIYMSVVHKSLHYHPKTLFLDDSFLPKICPSVYQYEYDRKFHRRFNSTKIVNTTGVPITTDIVTQLKQSTIEFLNNPSFADLNIKNEAILDALANDPWGPINWHSKKNLIRYLYHRMSIFTGRAF